jgi:hypothetical protein
MPDLTNLPTLAVALAAGYLAGRLAWLLLRNLRKD